MTPAEAHALGRRALAAGFVIAPRCAVSQGPDVEPATVIEVDERGHLRLGWPGWTDDLWDVSGDATPLFTDAATLGVLEAQVRAKHRDLQARVLTAYRDGAWPQTITLSADHATFESFMAAPEWLTALRRHSEEIGALLVRSYQLRMVPDDAEAEAQSVLALVAALEAWP